VKNRIEDTTGEGEGDNIVHESPDKVELNSCDGDIAEVEEGDDVNEGVADENSISGFDSDFSSSAQSDTDVGLSESRAVIHTVTNESDLMAFFLELLDDTRLVLGKLLSENILLRIRDTNLVGHTVSGVLVITSDHHGSDSTAFELGNEVSTFGLGFIGKCDTDANFTFGSKKNDSATFVMSTINKLSNIS